MAEKAHHPSWESCCSKNWYYLNLCIFGSYCQILWMTLWINYKKCVLHWFGTKNKTELVGKKTVVKDVNDEGLGLPDLKNILLLMLSWIRKLQNTNHKWKNIFLANYPSADNFKHLGPNFASEIKKTNILASGKTFLMHTNYFAIRYNLAVPINSSLNPFFITKESKLETKWLHIIEIALRKMSIVLQIC